jgi:hypothetical protein
MLRVKDPDFLQAAIAGYEKQLREINAGITQVERRLKQKKAPPMTMRAPQRRHGISPEGRARIAEAQRKRWAAVKEGRQENSNAVATPRMRVPKRLGRPPGSKNKKK